MDRRGRVALEEAQKWADEGIIDAAALPAIRQRYASQGDDTNWATDAFYTVGGVLIGAAVIAIGTFMDLQFNEQMQAYLLASAALLFLAGILLNTTQVDRGAVDAAFIASLIPAVMSAIVFDGSLILQWLALPIALALVVWRRDRPILVTAATIGALIALPIEIASTFNEFTSPSEGDTEITLWWIVASLALVATLLVPRFDRRFAHEGPQGAAAISYVISSIVFTEAVIDPSFTGGIEVILAGFFVAALVAGVLLRSPATLIVSILAITVDAIVFSFDVGGFALGVTSLIVLAIAMVATAVAIQKKKLHIPGWSK